jgi:riboflavin-specific deaminase-like protein
LRAVDQLLPRTVKDVDAAELYRGDRRTAHADKPWVAVNMVSSIDGAVTLDGRSGGLSGPGDKAIFFALRSIADVILVGAGTVRAENYGPPRISAADQEARRARGQDPVPTIAVVSGRLHLDTHARLFVDSPTRPIVLTTEHADTERRAALEPIADIVAAGDTTFDAEIALERLYDRGTRVVICEGGPTLNGWMLAADLVDELCLTVAPLVASGDDARVARGLALDPPQRLLPDRILTEDGFLFLRYLAAR